MRRALDQLTIGTEEPVWKKIKRPQRMRALVQIRMHGIADAYQKATRRPAAFTEHELARSPIRKIRQLCQHGAGWHDIAQDSGLSSARRASRTGHEEQQHQ